MIPHATNIILSLVAFLLLAFVCWTSYTRVFRPEDNFMDDVLNPRHYHNNTPAKSAERLAASESVRNAAIADPNKFGIDKNDVHTIRTADSVPSAKPGVRHVYLTQEVAGIPIYNARLGTIVKMTSNHEENEIYYDRRKLWSDRNGAATNSDSIVTVVSSSASTSLIRNAEQCVNTHVPLLSAEETVFSAARYVLGIDSEALQFMVLKNVDDERSVGGLTREVVFAPLDNVSSNNILCQLVYWSVVKQDTKNSCDIRLSWEIILRPNSTHWLQVFMDATDGRPLHITNWARSVSSFSAVPFPNENPCPSCPSYSADLSEVSFDIKDIQPLSLVSNPEWDDSSPKGWLTIGNVLFNETRGNNVRAAVNVNETAEDYYLTGTTAKATDPSLSTFDYSYQNIQSENPADWTEAAIVNAFYWSNIMHDILYQYGFDEESGNFQEENFGLGGLEGDSVILEVQV